MFSRLLLISTGAMALTISAAMAQPAPLATGPEPFIYKSDADLAAMTFKPGISPAAATLSNHEHYQTGVVVRTKDGVPELHTHHIDVMSVQHGDGWVTYGNNVVGARDIGNGELRGSQITGGTTIEVHPGDYFQIPAGLWHQIGPKPGGKIFRYTFVKIRQ
jgi:mannose-6-phosphate isomerase-like protein (cupin superfamily)